MADSCHCTPSCECRAGLSDGCRCQRRLCPVLCQCTPKCLALCDCAEPCVVLEGDLQDVECERNGHIEVLTADGSQRDHDPSPSGFLTDDPHDADNGLSEIGEKLRHVAPLFSYLWEYRFNQGKSNVQIAELLGLGEVSVRRYVQQAIREIHAMTDLTSASKNTIVGCLRSGRQGGPRPERQQAKDKRLLLP